jgi:hypothetical protein
MEYVFYIVFVLSLFGYWTFSDYWDAKAELLRQHAREKELENDAKEFNHED